MNHLYFGDSLDILKQLIRQHPDGFIDLVYIDPPFNSKRNYNVLFETVDLHDAKAQKEAFADTWSNVSYKDTIEELKTINLNLSRFLDALDHVGISQSAVSYLTTMAIRIFYIRKVLKDTGSFYLHCDSTMSHYLKIICDIIFGEKSYRNDLIWKRTSAHSDAKRFGKITDTILYYTKSPDFIWNPQHMEYTDEYLKRFSHKDSSGREWMDDNLSAKGLSGGGYDYEYKGSKSLWRVPYDTMIELDKANKLYFTKTGGIRIKRLG